MQRPPQARNFAIFGYRYTERYYQITEAYIGLLKYPVYSCLLANINEECASLELAYLRSKSSYSGYPSSVQDKVDEIKTLIAHVKRDLNCSDTGKGERQAVYKQKLDDIWSRW